jgi:hypothetical protein
VEFLVGLLLGFGAALAYYLISRRAKAASPYLATAEYWVFLPSDRMPEQDAVMTRMVAQNPFSRRGRSPIGHAEGLLFSDIRLHIALVLRRKNAHVFRPDLFDSHIEADDEVLTQLTRAESFVKVRYLSEEPLKNALHLQFLPHAAAAYAALGGGSLIYDQTAERLIPLDAFERDLREHFDVTLPNLHTRVLWKREGEGCRAETRGLRKVGHAELVTPPIESDERTLVGQLLEALIEQLWTTPTLPEQVELEAFEDRFRVLLEPRRDRPTLARILRIQST